jgi:RimJ/RimL family protein N-acetyltransferase
MTGLYEAGMADIEFLYDLLKEREANENISHRHLPNYDDHVKFFNSKPYYKWCIIYKTYYSITDSITDYTCRKIGTIYLTKNDEIGIQIKNEYKHQGYGSIALKLLMDKCKKDKYYANISPHNFDSFEFFKKHGFSTIQWTLIKETS